MGPADRKRSTSLQLRRRSILETLEDRRVLASFTVVTGGDAGSGSCTTAACTLRDAITAANALAGPDEINFASNVTGTITLTPAKGELPITDAVSIIGPGAGSLTVRAGTSTTNQFRILDVAFAGGDVTVEGLTLSGGRVIDEAGGAIRFQSSGTLTIRDSVVTGNRANNGGAIYSEYDGTIRVENSSFTDNQSVYASGGAIHTIEADMVIQNSTFDNNRSYGSGGAVSIFSAGELTITDSQFTNNRSLEDGYNGGAIDSGDGAITISGSTLSGNTAEGGDGGAIYSIGGPVAISNSTFDGNTARYNGGAILNDTGDITITDSRVTNNVAQYGDGGGVSNFSGDITITRSTISTNSSVTDGGGVSNVSATMIVRNSTIDNNTAGGDGGGIATITGPLTLINSTVSGNIGNVRGGGIQTDNALVQIVQSTIADNAANISGGGIGTLNDGIFAGDNFASIAIRNSIVADNTSPTGPDFVAPPMPATSLIVRNSLIGNNRDTSLAASNGTDGNFIGTPTSMIDPQLEPLADNGGTTRTHQPLLSSLAIDGGDNTLAIDYGPDGIIGGGDDTAIESDQRGGLFVRIANASGSQAIVDMGAVERQPRPILTVDAVVDESDGNLASGDRSLRELIELANASEGLDTIIVPETIGSQINLLSALGPLVITDSVIIIGPGADRLTIRGAGAGAGRLVDITDTAGNVTIGGLTFAGGDAGTGDGGGIRTTSAGSLVLRNVEVSDNRAARGGGVFVNNGNLVVAASLIAENTATGIGGGIASGGIAASVTVIDSTVSSNTASSGGGIASASGRITTQSSTVTANTATGAGGGIAMTTGSSTLTLTNSIVADNAAASSADFVAPASPGTNLDVDFTFVGTNAGTSLAASVIVAGVPQPDASGNLIGGSSGATIGALLGPLADNGGPTRSHAPQSDSPVVDAASTVRLPLDTYDVNGNGSSTEILPIDVRGAARVVDGLDMGSVELAVAPALTWTPPTAIEFGNPLGTTQLNAVSNAAGTFTYSPPSGTVLNVGDDQLLTATFVPTNPLQFRSETITTTIDIGPAGAVVTWPAPGVITFGTPIDGVQLNATADVDGTFVYDPPSGTVLNAGVGQVLSVTFTPDDTNFNPVTRTVMIDVDKAIPVVTWTDPDDIDEGTPLSATQLNATADVAGTFVYAPVSGTILGVGTDQELSVIFTPTDADNYEIVTETVSINVLSTTAEDFGDAPSDYPVTAADDGARHAIGGPRLGNQVSADADGQPSIGADADDDDDGVFVIAEPIALADFATTASVLVTASAAGRLDAWIDFGDDGAWSTTDRIANDLPLVAGANVVSFTVPVGAEPAAVAARFRISTAGGLSPTGAAADGEVEDYIIELLDGEFQADAIVALPPEIVLEVPVIVSADGDEVVVSYDGDVLFRSPRSALTELLVIGGDNDDTLDLNTDNAGDSATLVIDGGSGINTLSVLLNELDLTQTTSLVLQNVAVVDLSSSSGTVLTLDAETVTSMSPAEETITVIGDAQTDRLIFTDASQWQMDAPEIIGGNFFGVALNQVSGQRVRGSMGAAWQNFVEPSDVNNSGSVTASDALVIINELGRRAYSVRPSGLLDDPATADPFPDLYFDQNGDGNVTALDALRVINRLAQVSREGESPEGEKMSVLLAGPDAIPSVRLNDRDDLGGLADEELPIVVITGPSVTNEPAAETTTSILAAPTDSTESLSSTESWSERVDDWFATTDLSSDA